MIAYTGIETVSNLAEEARDPVRSIPRSISWVAIAVFAIYFTLPWIALSAMPVVNVGGQYVTKLGQAPPLGFKNDPVLGLVENLGLHGFVLSTAKVYVGILAATILFIATNAGVIGASRITYSMSSHRQLPEAFRRLHPKLKTPWLALHRLRRRSARRSSCSRARSTSSGGCTRSARCSRSRSRTLAVIDAARARGRRRSSNGDARPNLKVRGIALAAVRDRRGARDRRGLARRRRPGPSDAVRGLRVAGRRASSSTCSTGARLQLPLTTHAARAGAARCRRSRSSTARSSCRSSRGDESREAVELAARLATERAGRIVLLRVIVVPLELPLDADLTEQLEEAERAARRGTRDRRRPTACASWSASCGRATPAGRSSRRPSGAAPRSSCSVRPAGATGTIFGHTVDYVLKQAPSPRHGRGRQEGRVDRVPAA